MLDGRKLKAIAESKRVSPVEIAVVLGYGTSDSVYKLFRNQRSIKDPEKIRELAKFLGVSERDILQDNVIDLVMPKEEGRSEARTKIPVVGKVSAGEKETLKFADTDSPAGYGAFGEVNLLSVGEDTYAVKVEGESMMPRFLPGEMLIVDPAMPFKSGKYYLIKSKDGRVWAMRVIKQKEQYILIPESSSSEPIILLEHDIDFIHRIRLNEMI